MCFYMQYKSEAHLWVFFYLRDFMETFESLLQSFFFHNKSHHQHTLFSFLYIISSISTVSLTDKDFYLFHWCQQSLTPVTLSHDHVMNQQIYVMISQIVHTTCNYMHVICITFHTCLYYTPVFCRGENDHLRFKWGN